MPDKPTFEKFPKIPRLMKEVIITEKIDGTNAQVYIPEDGGPILAGKRTRWLTPENDNFGFCKWVMENEEQLRVELGFGRHYGEWWGQGIQRTYGLTEKRFSLFNTTRWGDAFLELCHVVPVLYQGMWGMDSIGVCMLRLSEEGSVAAPGFMKPEGVVIFHTAASQLFKYTFDGDKK